MSQAAVPLRRKDEYWSPYSSADLSTLMQQLLESGYIANPSDVSWAWYKFSDSMCATWLCVREDEREYNVSALMQYLEPNV